MDNGALASESLHLTVFFHNLQHTLNPLSLMSLPIRFWAMQVYLNLSFTSDMLVSSPLKSSFNPVWNPNIPTSFDPTLTWDALVEGGFVAFMVLLLITLDMPPFRPRIEILPPVEFLPHFLSLSATSSLPCPTIPEKEIQRKREPWTSNPLFDSLEICDHIRTIVGWTPPWMGNNLRADPLRHGQILIQLDLMKCFL